MRYLPILIFANAPRACETHAPVARIRRAARARPPSARRGTRGARERRGAREARARRSERRYACTVRRRAGASCTGASRKGAGRVAGAVGARRTPEQVPPCHLDIA